MTDIELKRSTGGVYFSTLINEGAKRMRKLMEEDYITLPISTQNPLDIRLGDYVDIPNEGRFCIIETQYPSVNEENGGYDYDLKFEAQYRKWGNKIFKYQPDSGAEELSWKLTANIDVHAEQIKKAINVLGAKNPSYKYNGSLDWDIRFDSSIDHKIAKFISFDNINILDGISAIAEAFECEWWIDNDRMGNDKTNYRYLWFGKCEIGDLVEISRDINAESINRSDTGEKTANRIYPFGSTENIPPQYNKELVFNVSRNMGISSTKYPDSIAIIDTARPISHLWFDKSKVEEISHIVELPFNAFNYGDVWIDTNGKDTPTCALERIDFAELQSGNKYKFLLKDFFVAIVPHFWKNSVESYNYEAQIRLAYKTDYKLDENFTHSTFHYFAETYVDSISGNEQRLKFKDESIEVEIPMTMDVSLTYNHFPILVTIETDKILDKAIYMELRIKVKDKGRLTWTNTSSKIYYDNGVKPTYIIRDLKVEFKTGTQSGITYDAIYDSAVRSDSAGIIIPNVDVDIDDKFYIKGIDELKVPSSYFSPKMTNEVGNQTINAIADGRLMLSKDKGSYIDAYRYLNGDKIFIDEKDYDIAQEMPLEEAIEDVVIFEDIKPDHTFKITNIWTTIEDGTDQDGNPTTITRFFFNDELFTANNQFKNEYIIEGKELSMRFSSGKLNGMTFNIKYVNESGQPTQWEIIVDEESHLPSAYYMPEIEDEFTMSGLNVLIINDQYLSLAQEELYDVAKDYISKGNIDASAYDVVMFSDVMESGLSLPLGQRVLLKENVFFKNGRESRVIGYEYPLDIPYDSPKYTIGEKASYSRIGDIESKLESIELSVKSNNSNTITTSQVTSSINNIIGSNDELTPVDDKNVFSALRSVKEFVSKKKSEVINYIWNFTKGITIGQGGATINMDGDAEVESLKSRTFIDADYVEANEVISNNIHTPDFAQGSLGGSGGAMYQLKGFTYAEFDYLTARKGATFAELIIQEYRSIAGSLVVSEANGEIESVYKYANGYNVWLKDVEKNSSLFEDKDLVRCQYWDRTKNEFVQYWVPVSVGTDASGKYVLTIYNEHLNGVEPQIGDKLVHMGNTTNKKRQGCILITTENGLPRISILDGIDQPRIINTTEKTNYKSIYGSLDGFVDPYTNKMLNGYGLWSDHVYLNGEFRLSSYGKSLEDSLANISSGGKNLLVGTNKGSTHWSLSSSLNGIYTSKSINYNGINGVQFLKSDMLQLATYETFKFPLRPQKIIEGKIYHLSFDAMQTENNGDAITLNITLCRANGQGLLTDVKPIKLKSVDGKWKHYDIELKSNTSGTDDGGQVVYFAIRRWEEDNQYWNDIAFANLKLEEGLYATDWSLAPEDVVSSFTEFKVTTEGLTSRVENSEGRITTIEQTAEGISLKVGGLEKQTISTTNLLLKSNEIKENKDYLLGSYDFGSVAPQEGEEVTLSFSGYLGTGHTYFNIYNSGWSVLITRISSADYNQITKRFEKTFKWVKSSAENTLINIFQAGASGGRIDQGDNENADRVASKVFNAMLTKSNKAVGWQPSSEDTTNALLDTGINIKDKKIEVIANYFTIKNNNGENVASADKYGNWSTNTLITLNDDGTKAITINEEGNRILTHYYPYTNQKQLEEGWNGISLFRYYDENGVMLWQIGGVKGFMSADYVEWTEVEMYETNLDFDVDNLIDRNLREFIRIGDVEMTTYYQHNEINDTPKMYKTKSTNNPLNGWFTNQVSWQPFDSYPEDMEVRIWKRSFLHYTKGVEDFRRTIKWDMDANEITII